VTYPLFDSFIALKPQGLALSVPYAVKGIIKRSIKSSPRLWDFAQTVRKFLGRGAVERAS